MAILSVRIPKDLETRLPKRDRSAWVIQALRDRLRRERVRAIARDAAENAERELQTLREWETATAPLPRGRK
jgi:hypothetical protein